MYNGQCAKYKSESLCGGAAGEGANGTANGNVQISELGACGAALSLFSPCLGVGESRKRMGVLRGGEVIREQRRI